MSPPFSLTQTTETVFGVCYSVVDLVLVTSEDSARNVNAVLIPVSHGPLPAFEEEVVLLSFFEP